MASPLLDDFGIFGDCAIKLQSLSTESDHIADELAVGDDNVSVEATLLNRHENIGCLMVEPDDLTVLRLGRFRLNMEGVFVWHGDYPFLLCFGFRDILNE